jgi:hypothetical protein
MENALRACCKGIKIGKILIHREGDNGQQVWFHPLSNFAVGVRVSLTTKLFIFVAAHLSQFAERYCKQTCSVVRSHTGNRSVIDSYIFMHSCTFMQM